MKYAVREAFVSRARDRPSRSPSAPCDMRRKGKQVQNNDSSLFGSLTHDHAMFTAFSVAIRLYFAHVSSDCTLRTMHAQTTIRAIFKVESRLHVGSEVTCGGFAGLTTCNLSHHRVQMIAADSGPKYRCCQGDRYGPKVFMCSSVAHVLFNVSPQILSK